MNIHWRRFHVEYIPLEDPKEFEAWLIKRWEEKDQLLTEYFETGRFPSELAGWIKADHVEGERRVAAKAGFVESDVRVHRKWELALIFLFVPIIVQFYRTVISWLS